MSERERILQRLRTLGIAELCGVTELNRFSGAYLNLPCRLPNGQTARLLEDDKEYYACQVERPGNDRCYGVAADSRQLAVYEYGCGGADAQLVAWVRL